MRQNWSTLGFSTKIIATLGLGVVAYLVGALLYHKNRTLKVSLAFFLIFSLITPMGLWVLLDYLGVEANSHGAQSIISGIMFAACFISLMAFNKNIFLAFCIIFATWFFFDITSFLISNRYFFNAHEFYKYRILLLGVAYMFLGYAFSQDDRRPFSEVLYGVGSSCFLVAALTLGYAKHPSNLFWEIIYPVLTFVLLGLSARFKSQMLLVCSVFFLMVYIFKMTAEYFSKSLGWPLSLVIVGFAMIGVAYLAVSINKKL